MTFKSRFLLIIFLSIFTVGCSKDFFKKVDTRKTPVNAQERAKKNVEEGRGIAIGNVLKRNRNTNFEFSTANPMWRASLEILDFLPMTTVDYAGGMIISDWYTQNNTSNEESIKITVRFLSNEVRSDSIKIVVHKKVCKNSSACSIAVLNNSTISQELRTTIVRKAALLEKEAKDKKKN